MEMKEKLAHLTKLAYGTAGGAGELVNLSESLNVEGIIPKSIELTGIPDVWARPLLFEMALYDDRHPLHNRIFGEWLGLLAIVALKEWRKFVLSAVEVKIPDYSMHGVSSGTGPNFLRALRNLAPEKTLAEDNNWYKLHVILFSSKPIAITSPSTIVCTAANYFGRIKGVEWFNGEFLTDPSTKLNEEEKRAFVSWLEQFKDNLINHKQLNDGTADERNKLLGLIDKAIKLLGDAPATPFKMVKANLEMTQGIFRYLDQSIDIDELPTEKSHVLLMASRTPPVAEESILVISEAIAEQWGKEKNEVFVSRALTLASIPFGGLGGNHKWIGSISLEQKRKWEQETYFFTEKLFVIRQQDAFPCAIRIKGADNLQFQGTTVTPILPINKDLLNYLTADDLSQRIRFDQRSEGIVVYLQLRLSGLDGKGKDFIVKKEFMFKESKVVPVSTVPVLEVWPNFKVKDKVKEGWNLYYSYFSTAGEETFYAKPFTLGKEKGQQVFEGKSGRKIEREITRMEVFPEAMICSMEVADIKTGTMESVDAGILLLKQPELAERVTGKKWIVGIDFGTTGTNVYVNDMPRDPFPAKFEERHIKISAASEQRRTCLYDDFLPGGEETAPFLSIFHDFQKTPEKMDMKIRPLLDGHIYFLLDHEKFNVTIPGMVTDLKWSEDPLVRKRTHSFLEQLCLQSLVEAAANGAEEIGWRFSYPTAFSSGDIEDFEKIWQAITVEWDEYTRIRRITEFPQEKIESVASARFFAYHPKMNIIKKGYFKSGMVCIDIGGGTSDISIYRDNKLLWQTSLRFAGRDMFLDLLYAKPNLLDLFGADTSALRRTRGNRIAFYAQADAIINSRGQDWLKNLHIFGGEPEVKGFEHLIVVGLSGIFYYIGSVLKSLSGSTDSEYRTEMPNIYVAGNGSKIFHWVAAGLYSNNSPINALFKNILSEASGFSTAHKLFNIHISIEPKAESAFGLVCDGTGVDESARIDKIVAGEMFMEGGKQLDWDEAITAERLAKGIDAPQRLKKLGHFIEIYNAYANQKGAVVSDIKSDDILIKAIRDQLAETLADAKNKDPKAIHVEPLFITELKTLLKIKTEEWASK